jgi:hypothetical protein
MNELEREAEAKNVYDSSNSHSLNLSNDDALREETANHGRYEIQSG